MKRTYLAILLTLALTLSSTLAYPLSLGWTLSTSPGVISQRLYISRAPVNPGTGRFDAPVIMNLGLVTSIVVGPLPANETLYFAVTATDAYLESAYSNVVVVESLSPRMSPIPAATAGVEPMPELPAQPTPPGAPVNLYRLPDIYD
jgi:hypothetical protein